MALDLMGQVADGLADAHAAGLDPPRHQARQRAAAPAHRRQPAPTSATSGSPGRSTRRVGHRGHDHRHHGHADLHGPRAAPRRPGRASPPTSTPWAACSGPTLTGRAPYAGTSDYQIVTAHLEQPVPQLDPSSELAVEANRILRTAMAKDPAERYPSAAAMRDDLRRAALLPEAPLTGPPVEETAASRHRRRPRAGRHALPWPPRWPSSGRRDARRLGAGRCAATRTTRPPGPTRRPQVRQRPRRSSSSSSPTSSDSGSADPPADGDERERRSPALPRPW